MSEMVLASALEDVLVLDLSLHLSGPFTSRILADLGARIVKVEPREGRKLPYSGEGPPPGFVGSNLGKQSIAVDLKSAQGRQVIHDLAKVSDVVLENFRPGVTKRLGVDYESLRKLKPDLIYCTITGFGSSGPLATKPAFDAIIQAMSGAMEATGESDRPPALMTVNIGDLAASCLASNAIQAALRARDKGAGGAHIDMSMLESLMYLMVFHTQFYLQQGYVMGRHGSGYGPRSIAGAFETSDGKYIQVLCPYVHFQDSLQKVISEVPGFDHLNTDPRFASELARAENNEAFLAIARQAFVHRSEAEWLALLEAADIPHGRIQNVGEALTSAQAVHRGMVAEVEAPEYGVSLPSMASPFHTAISSVSPRRISVPAFAEHTRAVLGEVLGYPEQKIDELVRTGVVAAREAT